MKRANPAFVDIRVSPGRSPSRRIVGLVLAGMACFASPARAQWTTGSGGTIYYNGGKVGIGTASPAGPLHISAAVNATGLLLDNGVLIQQKNSAGAIRNLLTHYANEIVYLDNPDGTVMIRPGINGVVTPGIFVVTNSGFVGIGTENPQYKLAVNGTIGTKDIIVTNTGWSDYVFRPTYRLRPLSEVDAYIQKHHHLPDIPTAAEVKRKGVNVGDMQAKLLAKVEELTLHMIQQDKENRVLRERMNQEQRENQDLRKRLARLEQAAADSNPAAGK